MMYSSGQNKVPTAELKSRYGESFPPTHHLVAVFFKFKRYANI